MTLFFPLLAAAGVAASATNFTTTTRSTFVLSPVQKRMREAWLADAPRREALKAEIAEWNAKVVRRNRAFVITGKNKHQRWAA